MHSVLKGALGGALATVPMTLFMRLAHRHLPSAQKYPLPPEQITTKLARAVGMKARPHKPGWEWKTYAGHFSYGTAVGSLYSLFFSRPARRRTNVVVRGCGYGLLVWATSYLGWLPAAGILPPATREPKPRNAITILAHVIWGVTLALIVDSAGRRNRSPVPRASPNPSKSDSPRRLARSASL